MNMILLSGIHSEPLKCHFVVHDIEHGDSGKSQTLHMRTYVGGE